MLVDEVTIMIRAGAGGNGSAALRRNAQTARGGPDGGNGGNGGNVYFQGIDDISALRQFQFNKKLLAEDGIGGGKNNLYGRNGSDLIVRVPVGTLIKDIETNQFYDIADTTTRHLLAKGGIGGRGNNEFKTSTNQTPKYAEPGTPGIERDLRLKLRLIADVGFIGLPNAGKSSLLTALTNATPKIGNYPFTTLEPSLGMLGTITLADIPGLIEGASSGKGLGTKFLKHVEKTKLLFHCISCENEDVLKTYEIVRNELEQYSTKLPIKKEVILLTKTDLVDNTTLEQKYNQLKKTAMTVLPVSIHDEEKLETLVRTIQEAVK